MLLCFAQVHGSSFHIDVMQTTVNSPVDLDAVQAFPALQGS